MARKSRPTETPTPTQPAAWSPPVDVGRTADDAPRLGTIAPVLLQVHRERWHVQEGQVVPQVKRLTLKGGVHQVRQNRDGSFQTRAAIADWEERGWHTIPHDVDGPGTSYLHNPAPGAYLTRWETAHAGSSLITSDGPGYVAWLRGLIEAAPPKIPRCPPYVLERMLAQRQQELSSVIDRAQTQPSLQAEVARLKGEIAAITEELAAGRTPVAQRPVAPLLDAEE